MAYIEEFKKLAESSPVSPIYHKWLRDDTIKIKLMKMSKGYQWELSAEGEDTTKVIDRLDFADLLLRQQYGESTSHADPRD